MDRMDMTGCQPRAQTITLCHMERVVKVITFDFTSMVRNLFDDKDLINPKIFLPDYSIYGGPEDYYDHYGDLHTGKAWKVAHECMCKRPEDVLCPIILFVDKTATNKYGQLSLEPVSFTLGWFNAKTRRKASAWRVLGYVPNLGLQSTEQGRAMNLGDSTREYHQCMRVILQDLAQVQRAPITIDMDFDNYPTGMEVRL